MYYSTFKTIFTIKKSNVRSIVPEDEKKNQSVINDTEKLVMAETRINKKNNKISDTKLKKIRCESNRDGFFLLLRNEI